MIFDINNVFFGTSPFTAGNFVSLAGLTGNTTSTVINLSVAEDMGIGDGVAVPNLAIYIGTGITSASGTATVNLQIQGSTDSSNWTTYAESGALTTGSLTATGGPVFPIALPKRPAGAALPQYYRLNVAFAGNGSASISTGTIMAGIVLQRADSDNTLGQYKSGFSVGS